MCVITKHRAHANTEHNEEEGVEPSIVNEMSEFLRRMATYHQSGASGYFFMSFM
jgi:hypothetical protein